LHYFLHERTAAGESCPCLSAFDQQGWNDRSTLETLDACQLDQAVCFAPFPHQCEEAKVEPNSWLAEELKSQSRLFAFGTVDVRRNDLSDQVRRIKELDFKASSFIPMPRNSPS